MTTKAMWHAWYEVSRVHVRETTSDTRYTTHIVYMVVFN